MLGLAMPTDVAVYAKAVGRVRYGELGFLLGETTAKGL
jgi:hypothetical protein